MIICHLSIERMSQILKWLSVCKHIYFIRSPWVYHGKPLYYSTPGRGSLCMFDSKRYSLHECNKEKRFLKEVFDTVASPCDAE